MNETDPSDAPASAIDPSRRTFLLRASASALALGGGLGAVGAMSASADHLTDLTATAAIGLMRSGELSSEQYATALLARCAQFKALNAFITLDPPRVMEQARAADRLRASGAKLGLLHGLPIPVKDSLNTAEYPTSGGTPALRDFRPAADAPLVATLRAAGAIVLGKTNLHELSFGWTSNNHAFGAVHNPYNLACIPGGSSGGTAVAIASHMAPLGIAEDTEGSIRVPAALCGVVGFRPSTGRYSTVGAIPISSLFDQAGPHARSMADVALFDRVATGDLTEITASSLKGVRLAVSRGYWFDGLDPEVERITTAALAKLRAAGATLVEAEVPGLQGLIDLITDQVQNHDVRVQLAQYLARYGAKYGFDDVVSRASPDIRATFAHDVIPGAPGFVSEAVYDAAVKIHLPRLRDTFRDYFVRTGAAALVFPATMVTAPKIGDETELTVRGRKVRFDIAVARNIAPGSTAGLPGLVVPAGVAADGLPVAIEFDGPAGSDRSLLALGMAIEAALGTIPPPRL